MKELSIEEKAKRYDLAIEAASCIYANMKEGGDFSGMEDLEVIFPQLAESEDERIKNFISNELMCLRAVEYNSGGKDSDRYKELTSAIAWLEKQGEQKSADKVGVWSEEDENIICFLINIIEDYKIRNGFSSVLEQGNKAIDWIKSLKDRVQPQSKQEWSKEDKEVINLLLELVYEQDKINPRIPSNENIKMMISWLKSLQPQNTWKPNDEQMENLIRAINGGSYRTSLLMELYQDLKKL